MLPSQNTFKMIINENNIRNQNLKNFIGFYYIILSLEPQGCGAKFLEKMTHNVLVVYDVLATRTGKHKGIQWDSYPAFVFTGLPKCGWSEPWERCRRPTDLGERNPEPPIKAA
jgi:hypothetical protein